MLSRIVQLDELRQRSVMFWLPPGGRDNGVWASTWVMLAELDPADAAPLLSLLHDADIGGYAAKPSGSRGRPDLPTTLYVDRDQLPKATDVVMRFLRGRNDPPPMAMARRAARKAASTPRSTSTRTAGAVAKIACCDRVIAGFTALIYIQGTQWLAMTHQRAHRLPPSHLSGITNPAP